MSTKESYEKFLKGDPISDDALIELNQDMKSAADVLIKLGPRFSIAFKEANNVYMTTSEFIRAKGLMADEFDKFKPSVRSLTQDQ